MISFVDSLLTLALPLVCGFVAACIVKFCSRRPSWLAFGCLGANFISIGLSYIGFLVLIGVTAGSWPDSLPPSGLAYGLIWFAIPSVFTSVPLTVGGYVCGILCTGATTQGMAGHPRSQPPSATARRGL
jgi:hypothetical protein